MCSAGNRWVLREHNAHLWAAPTSHMTGRNTRHFISAHFSAVLFQVPFHSTAFKSSGRDNCTRTHCTSWHESNSFSVAESCVCRIGWTNGKWKKIQTFRSGVGVTMSVRLSDTSGRFFLWCISILYLSVGISYESEITSEPTEKYEGEPFDDECTLYFQSGLRKLYAIQNRNPWWMRYYSWHDVDAIIGIHKWIVHESARVREY